MARNAQVITNELDELEARREPLESEMRELHVKAGDRELTRGEQQRWDRLQAGVDKLDDQRRALVRELAELPGHTESGDGARGDEPRRDGRPADQQRAMRRLDELVRSDRVPAFAAERAEALMSDGAPAARSLAARWAEATSSAEYERAFTKLLADPQRGHLLWTPAEQEAYQRVAAVQAEQRAMSVGTDSAGGFMVPLTLDPSIMLSSDGSVNPLRRVARVVQTTTNAWSGVTSAGVTAEWKAEGAEVADASPTLAEPNIPVHFGDAFVPFSFEFGMDAVNAVNELQRLMVDAADQLQASAFMNGTGTGQPTGLTTGLASGSKVATTTADTLAIDDVTGLQSALPSRFQPRAQWLGNLTTINMVGGFETSAGSLRFPEVSSDRLLRKPLNEASELDAAGDTANAGNDNVLAYGDFAAGFVIVDRVGTSVELVPHLFGSNSRPTGQRGLLMHFRTGSDVVVDNAIRLLTA